MRFTLSIALVVTACGGGSSGPSEEQCRSIGNQPPCCAFFGHREVDGRCEEADFFDASFLDTGSDTGTDTGTDADVETDADVDTCERNDECVSTGPDTSQCCPGGVCSLGPCITGPAPPPPCEDRVPEFACDGNTVCVNDATCGWGTCELDCRIAGDCAQRGFVCDDDICTFDCRLEGFSGCPDEQVCRDNGKCGVPLCDATSCGAAADCMAVTSSPFSHRDAGCRPKPCATTEDCPADTYCINGGCSERPGMCGDATAPP